MSEFVLRGVVTRIQELLQCRYCDNIPQGSVFNCPKGHSLCEECYGGLRNCPSCDEVYDKSEAGGSRNLALESILEYNRDVLSYILDSATESACNSSDNDHDDQECQDESKFSSKKVELKNSCPYKKNGCELFHDKEDFSESQTHLKMVNHTLECPKRPIECFVRPHDGWRYDTDNEMKRFCGPSEAEREKEKLLQKSSSIPLFEMRSKPQLIPWENYIEHLQADHGATFSFERVGKNRCVYKKLDSIYAPEGLGDSDFWWPLDLMRADGKVFIRQQLIYKGEIQNRIFVNEDSGVPYVATVGVSKASDDSPKRIFGKDLRTVNVLPIRDYGQELLKLGWPNPRHDYSFMDTSFAEDNYYVEGQDVVEDATFAWFTWIDIHRAVNNPNPSPFNSVPTLVARSVGPFWQF